MPNPKRNHKRGCARLAVICLVLGGTLRGAPFVFTDADITSSSQIVLPSGMTNVLEAVNVGSTSANTVNGITFAADSGNWLSGNQEGAFIGNGYSAYGFTEGAAGGGLSGADFTATTINYGSNGQLIADPFTLLTPDTDYVFQLYLSDFHNQRGGQLTYMLGSQTEMQDIQQTLGSENLYQVSFNSGSETTFSWRLDPVTGHHDGKVAGFALYSASAIPEPATTAAVMAGGLLVIAAGRRRTKDRRTFSGW